MTSLGETAKSPASPRKRRVASAALVLGIALTGEAACANNSNTPPDSAVMVTEYKGRDLLCRTAVVNATVIAYDCDFPGYYANPNYKAPAETERIKEGELAPQTIPYLQGHVDCLVYYYNSQQTGSTCDYAGYWIAANQNPPAPATPTA